PEFSEVLQERLLENVSKTASVKNPLDCTFDMDLFNYYVKLPQILMESGEIDIIIIYGTFGFQDVLLKLLKNEKIAKHAKFKDDGNENHKKPLEKILIPPTLENARKYSIPILYINPQSFSSPWSIKMRNEGAALFKYWDRPVRCIAKLCEYSNYLQNKEKD
ncbi:MAG: hypothetical protein P8Y70_21080, partial [Candidatus Lokiarchaeota archaeon]